MTRKLAAYLFNYPLAAFTYAYYGAYFSHDQYLSFNIDQYWLRRYVTLQCIRNLCAYYTNSRFTYWQLFLATGVKTQKGQL